LRDLEKMSAPQVILEGKYVTRQSYFNGQHYNGWKNRKENYIQADDYELWMIIENGPHISVRITDDGKIVPKKPHEFDSDDFRRMKKNARAKKLLYFGLSPMSTLESHSVSPQRRYGMLFEWLMKEPIKSRLVA